METVSPMKVADVMSRQIDYATTDTSVKEVCRIIFGHGVNGVPVCKDKKVIGFITERDILSKFFPTMQEYVEDPVHESDFEAMEKKVSHILGLKASAIMSKNPTTVRDDAPLLRAQSLMNLRKVGRLPVVDEDGLLLGIISRSDIFRSLIGDNLPFLADEEYHDWLSKHYDMVVQWNERLKKEIPDLVALFQKEHVEDVLDIGSGTGEHDMALAEHGFSVLGLETSKFMSKSATEKLQELSARVRQQVQFVNNDYVETLQAGDRLFGAAIFLGNAFCHLVENHEAVLDAVVRSLYIKNSFLVFQIINYEKVFKVKHRFLDMNFAKSKFGIPYEHAFLEFYDKQKTVDDFHRLTMAIFDFDGKRWKHRSMHSTSIVPLDQESIKKMLRKKGFKDVQLYGGNFLGPLFQSPFKPLESDWLNVVARR